MFGLDFGAVIQMASLRGAATSLLAEVLPAVEQAAVAGMNVDTDDE